MVRAGPLLAVLNVEITGCDSLTSVTLPPTPEEVFPTVCDPHLVGKQFV